MLIVATHVPDTLKDGIGQLERRVLPLAEVDPASATYFAIILVFKEAASWR